MSAPTIATYVSFESPLGEVALVDRSATATVDVRNRTVGFMRTPLDYGLVDDEVNERIDFGMVDDPVTLVIDLGTL